MEIIKVVLVLFMTAVFSACSGQGTEVLNPSSTLSVKGINGTFTLDLPSGWTYELCTEDASPCNEVYQDPVGTAEALALLQKGESQFVFLSDSLSAGETLTEYVDSRKQSEDETDSEAVDGMEMIIVNQAERGENDGSVIFIYASDGSLVVVIRIEIVADTVEEAQSVADEFIEMGNSITIEE